MLKPDVTLTDIRSGEYVVYTFTYYADDGTTPSSPTSVQAVVLPPTGVAATYTTTPEVTGATNEWTISIPITTAGDWYIDMQATWTGDVLSYLIHIPASEALA